MDEADPQRRAAGTAPPEPGRRLEARARELEKLQALGRAVAEAQAPEPLFSAAASILAGGGELDVVLVAHALDGSPEVLVYPSRPLDPELESGLTRTAWRLLDGAVDREPCWRRIELLHHDRAEPPRTGISREEPWIVALERGSRILGWIVALPAAGVGEARMRLLLAAADQLAGHLERYVAARASEAQRIHAVLEAMPQAVLVADSALRITHANRAARALLGPPIDGGSGGLRAAAVGLRIEALVDGVHAGRAGRADEEVALDDGRAFQVTVDPLEALRPARRGLVVVLTEVSETRRLQQRLAHAEQMSSLGQMIAGVAHELNNPLSTILTHAELLLRRGAGDERALRQLGTLHDEAQRCRRIVEDLLSFARRRERRRGPCSLNEIVTAVARLLGYQLRADGVALRTELDPQLPAIDGEGHALRQLLVNLLLNARDAIRDAGRTGTVVVRTAPAADGGARLEVEDDGPGIPDDLRPRIFAPFFTTKPDGRGTGLGLALVAGTVAAHGGTIEVHAARAGGARFAIALPPRARPPCEEPT